MSRRARRVVRAHSQASSEIFTAFRYYENQRAGLAADLAAELRRKLEKITRFPLMAPPWKGRSKYRVATLARFPFRLSYEVHDGDIFLTALANTHRHPGDWENRAKSQDEPKEA